MFKINKLKSQNNIKRMYLYVFFHNLIFAYVIERLFGLERGITIEQMVYIEIIYAVAVFILEVPTGIIADIWGRKNVMVISTIFEFFEFFFLIFAYDFTFFLLSTLAAAISGSLASGTQNALIYDSLKIEGKEKDFEKILARIKLIDAFSFALASMTGSFISSKYGYTSVYWMSLTTTVIAILLSFTFHEPEIKSDDEYETDEESNSFDFKEIITFFKTNNSVKFVVLYSVLIASIITYVEEYWQIYLQEINIPVTFFGFFLVIYSLFLSLSAMASYRLKEMFSYKFIFSVCVIFIGLILYISGNITEKYGGLVLLSVFLFYGIVETLSAGYLHHRAESKYRATVESVSSLAERFVTIIVGLIFGYVATNLNIFIGLKTLGIITLVYGIFYLIYQFKFVEEDKTDIKSSEYVSDS